MSSIGISVCGQNIRTMIPTATARATTASTEEPVRVAVSFGRVGRPRPRATSAPGRRLLRGALGLQVVAGRLDRRDELRPPGGLGQVADRRDLGREVDRRVGLDAGRLAEEPLDPVDAARAGHALDREGDRGEGRGSGLRSYSLGVYQPPSRGRPCQTAHFRPCAIGPRRRRRRPVGPGPPRGQRPRRRRVRVDDALRAVRGAAGAAVPVGRVRDPPSGPRRGRPPARGLPRRSPTRVRPADRPRRIGRRGTRRSSGRCARCRGAAWRATARSPGPSTGPAPPGRSAGPSAGTRSGSSSPATGSSPRTGRWAARRRRRLGVRIARAAPPAEARAAAPRGRRHPAAASADHDRRATGQPGRYTPPSQRGRGRLCRRAPDGALDHVRGRAPMTDEAARGGRTDRTRPVDVRGLPEARLPPPLDRPARLDDRLVADRPRRGHPRLPRRPAPRWPSG